LGIRRRNLTKLSPLTDFGAIINASNFGGQKVKGQDHGEVKYASKCTFWLCSCHMLAEA